MSRSRLLNLALVVAVSGLIACPGGFKGGRTEEAALRNLKRGSINSDGLYSNDFYEFELNLPKAWQGQVGDPPLILVSSPPEKEIPDSNARKFIDISVLVSSAGQNATIESAIDQYVKSNGYELTFQKTGRVEKASSTVLYLTGKWKESNVKLLSLLMMHDKWIVIVQCRALSPLFDNVEAQFAYCIGAFKITAKTGQSSEPTPTPNPYDYKIDFIKYTVRSGDNAEDLAKRLMGGKEYSATILKQNGVTELPIDSEILIPRFLTHVLTEGDTYESISIKYLGDSKYALWIKQYNSTVSWSVGETAYIPLYELIPIQSREEYSDLSKRVYSRVDLVDTLLIFNGGSPLNSLTQVRTPIFLYNLEYSYTVQQGDTLAFLATWFTGDSKNYSVLAKYNNISQPYTLTAGQLIKFPRNLIKDPSVFSKARPKTRPTPTSKSPESKATPGAETPKSTEKLPSPSTPTPVAPKGDDGIYEPD